MHPKLFSGRAPPGPAGELSQYPQTSAAFIGRWGNGEGRAGGKIKEEMEGWEEVKRKGREGRE